MAFFAEHNLRKTSNPKKNHLTTIVQKTMIKEFICCYLENGTSGMRHAAALYCLNMSHTTRDYDANHGSAIQLEIY